MEKGKGGEFDGLEHSVGVCDVGTLCMKPFINSIDNSIYTSIISHNASYTIK